MSYRQEHLGDLIQRLGVGGDGTAAIVGLLEAGLFAERDRKQKAREIAKAGEKPNPFFTDAGKCERAIYKRLIEEEESNPLTVDSLANFKLGNAIEDAFGSVLAKAVKGRVLREVSMEVDVDGVRVSGRSDFLVLAPVGDNQHAIIELKKTSSRAMKFMLSRDLPGRDEHRRQLNLYLHASHQPDFPCLTCMGKGAIWGHQHPLPCWKCNETGKRSTAPFEVGYLVYLIADATKGEPVAHAFQVVYDEFGAKSDLEFLRHVAKRAETGDDPSIPEGYSKTKFPCSYCSFQKNCWGAA